MVFGSPYIGSLGSRVELEIFRRIDPYLSSHIVLIVFKLAKGYLFPEPVLIQSAGFSL